MRGFIGPLGDDFPALLPIALGLMFFFASIAIAYDTYYYKDTQATLIRANIMISRSVRQQPLMTEGYWTQSCGLISDIQANYGVHAALMLVRPHYSNEPLMEEPLKERVIDEQPYRFKSQERALCPTTDHDFKTWVEDNDIPFTNPSRPVLTLTYPAVVEMGTMGDSFTACEGTACQRKPAVLVVYTWK